MHETIFFGKIIVCSCLS